MLFGTYGKRNRNTGFSLEPMKTKAKHMVVFGTYGKRKESTWFALGPMENDER